MSASVELLPAAEASAVPDGYELIDGRLVEKPVSEKSSWVGGQLFGLLWDYCRTGNHGRVWPADNGYRCFAHRPKLVRKPDVSFVRADRLPAVLGDGDTRVAPDLAVEVVSPNETAYELDEKINDYLSAGTPLVWEINPDARQVLIYRSDGSIRRLGEDDELSAEDVLPGFRCRLSDLLPPSEPG
jgi:Uma2 family endonuclease